MSTKKRIILRTIGGLDIGETVGWQATRPLEVGEEISLARQIPKNSKPYGIAIVQEVHPDRKNWAVAIRTE